MDLRDILGKRMNQLGIGKQVTASQVCSAYNKAVVEIFGEDVAKDTEAISFKEGVLKVKTSSSVLSQEIQGKHKEIIEKIIKKTGQKKINRIIFSAN